MSLKSQVNLFSLSHHENLTSVQYRDRKPKDNDINDMIWLLLHIVLFVKSVLEIQMNWFHLHAQYVFLNCLIHSYIKKYQGYTIWKNRVV